MLLVAMNMCHNPYFTGNSFAIVVMFIHVFGTVSVTILILLETPLQSFQPHLFTVLVSVTILILLETPLQSGLPVISFPLRIKSQSLFYWKLLCNAFQRFYLFPLQFVTILILLETPLQLRFPLV